MRAAFDVRVDDREFKAAMREYLSLTSKAGAQVVNDKTRDWLFKSAREMPKARRAEIAAVVQNPKFISWYANQVFGAGNWDEDDWAAAAQMLRKRFASVGYMRSGFVKAAKQLPDSGKSRAGKQRRARGRERFRQVTARTSKANPRVLRSRFTILSGAENVADGAIKERMQEKALNRARGRVQADTQKYIDRKNKANARKVSR